MCAYGFETLDCAFPVCVCVPEISYVCVCSARTRAVAVENTLNRVTNHDGTEINTIKHIRVRRSLSRTQSESTPRRASAHTLQIFINVNVTHTHRAR